MSRAGQSTLPEATALTATSPDSSFIFRMGTNVAQMAKTVSFVRILITFWCSTSYSWKYIAVIVEGTLNSGFSSVDISRIPSHKFNSPLSFSYTDGVAGRSVRQYLVLLYWRLMFPCHSAIQPPASAITTVSTASELQTDPANGISHSILRSKRY